MAKAPKTLAERRDRFVHSPRWKQVYSPSCYQYVRHLHPEDAAVWRIWFNLSYPVVGYAYVFPTALGWENSLHAQTVREGLIYGKIVHDTDVEAKGSVFDALHGADPVGLRWIEARVAKEREAFKP